MELIALRIVAGLAAVYALVRIIKWLISLNSGTKEFLTFVGLPILVIAAVGLSLEFFGYSYRSCGGTITSVNPTWDGANWRFELEMEAYKDGIKLGNNPWKFVCDDKETLSGFKSGDYVGVVFKDYWRAGRPSEVVQITREARAQP